MKDSELMIQVRNTLSLTQEQMAEKMGYKSRVAVADVERGAKRLSGPARTLLHELNNKNLKI